MTEPAQPPLETKPSRDSPSTKRKDDSDSEEDNEEAAPKRALLSPVAPGQACTLVVFGADGDLARKKLLPTLFHSYKDRLLPRDAIVVGYARPKPLGRCDTTADFRELVVASLTAAGEGVDDALAFAGRCHFQPGQFRIEGGAFAELFDLVEREEGRRAATRRAGGRWRAAARSVSPASRLSLEGSREEAAAGGADDPVARLYYFAVPPFLYPAIAGQLRACGCEGASGAAEAEAPAVRERFILEKPFGKDLTSCRALLKELSLLRSSATYYMDHYLGKELVMNLVVLRFANECFGGVWSRQHLSSVQVILKETATAEGRGGYFDQYGIIRDVLQNHLLQMVALVAMEQPLELTAEHITAEKLKVLRACRPLELDDVVVGQYDGYKAHVGSETTTTETFATAVLTIPTPRWAGVPFVLKAGKALNEGKVELRINFKPVAGVLGQFANCRGNELVVRVQPEPAIYWKVRRAPQRPPRLACPGAPRALCPS